MSKQPSQKKLTVMNSDSYLFTINEAALIFRKNRREFVREYLESGKLSFVLLGTRKYIKHEEIKRFLKENEYVYDASMQEA